MSTSSVAARARAALSLALLVLLAAPAPATDDDSAPAPAAAGTDEIVLQGGSTLHGRVLKETDGHLYVDVGYTVLEVPKDIVASRSASDASVEVSDDAATPRLYSQAEGLPELTLEQAVERYGEGVVVIKQPSGLGSGFVVREDGWVITNSHVVQGEIDVTVTVHHATPDGVEKKVFEKVEIVAVNPFIDLALLKIDADELGDFPLRTVYLGDMSDVEVGETVFAVGAPLGMDRSVSEGIVSIKNRSQNGITYIQTTAAINPGNSGGPLFNKRGEVVGVNTWTYMFAEGLNFSIPIDFVKYFIENRDAFAFDRDNPNSGYRYLQPPRRRDPDVHRD